MGVRLNKVLTELNIGLQTAIDYLKTKKSLGEIKDDANVNTKISDEQYNALVKEFKGDKDVKTLAGMIFPKKKEKEKPKKEVKPEAAEVKEESRQTFTPLGKIDLSQFSKPAAKEKEAPKTVEPAPEPKAEVKPEPKPEPKPAPAPKAEPKAEVKAEVKPEPMPEPKPEPKPAPAPTAEPKAEVKPEPMPKPAVEAAQPEKPVEKVEKPDAEPSIYTLKSEARTIHLYA